MQVISLITGPLMENTYIVSDELLQNTVVIDPGSEAEKIMEQIDRKGGKVSYILLTHGHADHIGAVDELRKRYSAQVAIHKEDADMLGSSSGNLSQFLGNPFTVLPADIFLADGDVIRFGETELKIIHTPGHSPGSICLLGTEVIFSGDTLFESSIGRTDFPGGDIEAMRESLSILEALPGDYTVYPGHGGTTTLAQERAMNPYMGR